MVERFNGRVRREVLGITHYGLAELEIVRRDFDVVDNGGRQRVLDCLSPGMVPRGCLNADPAPTNPTYSPPNPSVMMRALRVVADAE
ncbi:hypothetical protein [Methylobacterium sp. D54C]